MRVTARIIARPRRWIIFKNPHHRRAKLVRLTEAGQRKYEQIGKIQTRWVNALSRDLSVKDLSAAVALLRGIELRLLQRTDLAGTGA